MAPHALGLTVSPSNSSATSVKVEPNLAHHLKLNPFDNVVDPGAITSNCYTSPITIINQAVFSILTKIFSYDTIGSDDLVDSHLQTWLNYYNRQNSFGVVPLLHKLQVRSGAANSILGYFSKKGTDGKPIGSMIGLNGLKYMFPVLKGAQRSVSLPLALNVSAIDYDDGSNSLVSNYSLVLSLASALNYPVLTPVNGYSGVELQHLTVLNQYLAALTGKPSIFGFEGMDSCKTFTKFNQVASVADLGKLYQDLLADSDIESLDLQELVNYALIKLNKLTGCDYAPFEYEGHVRPEVVFVAYGTNEATRMSQVVSKISDYVKVGLVKVRVPLPFNFDAFTRILPKTTGKLVVLSSPESPLKSNVSASLFMNGVYNRFVIESFDYPFDFQWTPVTITKVIGSYIEDLDPKLVLNDASSGVSSGNITANSCPKGNYVFWGNDNGDFLETANKLALSLSLDDSKTVSVRTKFDNGKLGGVFQSQLISTDAKSPNLNQIDSADVVVIENVSLLSGYDILATAKPGSTILLGHEKKIENTEEFASKLPSEFKRALVENHNSLVVIDFSVVEELESLNDSTKGFTKDFLIQVAFWLYAYPQLGSLITSKLLQANGNRFELLGAVLDTFVTSVYEKGALKDIKPNDDWTKVEEPKEDEKKDEKKNEEGGEEEPVDLPYFPQETSFYPNPRNLNEAEEEAKYSQYIDLASKLTFKEAYDVKQDLRPDLPVENFVVKVKENVRLTPDEYSRNIFHIEFDTTGTGLTYSIGEALGIHGRNHPEDVAEFINFYGIDANAIVEVTNKDDASVMDIRTVSQSLTENADFLGKPPKRFYEALAEYATDDKDKEQLNKLGGSEGAADLKKRQEVDFCTYFDILEEFKSARPPFEELIKLIAPLKRREYSIASSQKMHNNAVHLLVVVVDWTDSKGRKRWGHCSKYLSDLSIGDELVVSVKPSVMKLPPSPAQPIIMSGLGTGLAPFKAFIEEKVWQKEQGFEIGEIYLYMGSRHKKEEYLYGELWEAYKDSGILTHIGAAFSRDQPQKIYIQDKIRESIQDLTDAVVEKQGAFYLCGPTWPVPDITACLSDIVINGAKAKGEEIKDIGKVIEDMKEEGRYILEVY